MGVFRIKESVDDFFERDPFELFSMDLKAPPPSAPRKTGFWSSILLGLVLGVAAAGAAFYFLTREKRTDHDAPYAYFEIRVISPDGRPAVGAVIREGRKHLGVTDSFGEWRRFMRVKLGSSVLIDAKKEAAGGSLIASKSLAIPLSQPRSGDLEIKGSLQLEPEGGRGGRERRMVEIKAAPEALRPTTSNAPVPETSGTQESEAQVTAAPASGDVKGAESTPAPQSVLAENTPELGVEFDHGTIWFESDPESLTTLGPTLSALKQRAGELGLRVVPNSPLRLRLTAAFGQGVRLVRVDAFAAPSAATAPLFSFIRAPLDTPAQTARDLLWAATVHAIKGYQVTREDKGWRILPSPQALWSLAPGRVLLDGKGNPRNIYIGADGQALFLSEAEGDPCNGSPTCRVTTPGVRRLPPVPGWQLLSLRVHAGMGEQFNVYVAGYQAFPREGNLFEYWGVPEGTPNISILRAGKIIYRGRIQKRPGSVPAIHLPSAPVAQLVKP